MNMKLSDCSLIISIVIRVFEFLCLYYLFMKLTVWMVLSVFLFIYDSHREIDVF